MYFQCHLYSLVVIYYLVVKFLELRRGKRTVLFSLWSCFSLVQLPDLKNTLQVQKNPLGYIYACRLYAGWDNVCLCYGGASCLRVWRIAPSLTCNQACEVILSINRQGTKVPSGIPVAAHWHHWALKVYFKCCEMQMPTKMYNVTGLFVALYRRSLMNQDTVFQTVAANVNSDGAHKWNT